MSEEKITTKALCGQCKNYQYIDRFLSLCDLGRVKEFNEDGSIEYPEDGVDDDEQM